MPHTTPAQASRGGGSLSRIVAVFASGQRVGEVVDELRKIGFDRKDMIISNESAEAEQADVISVKSEAEELGRSRTFAAANGIELDTPERGLILALELPKHKLGQVAELIRQYGPAEVRID